MFFARAGFGTFSKTAVAAVNTSTFSAGRTLWLVALLISLCVDVSAQSSNVSITEYPLSNRNSVPRGITTGPDGALWFAEYSANKIGRITTSGVITEFNVPTANAQPLGITAGPDGALWFSESTSAIVSKIGRITTDGVVTEYSIPSQGAEPTGIIAGPDGALWFSATGCGTDANGIIPSKIGRITTAGVITLYPLSSRFCVAPIAITVGPDGAMWFAESGSTTNMIGRITTAGVITEYPVSQLSNGISCLTAGPDGALWFGMGSGIGRITTTGVITQYFLPTQSNGVSGITASPDGTLWFTESGQSGTGSKIGRITTSGVITEYSLPVDNSSPYSITAGSGGAFWFTEYGGAGSQIGRIQMFARTGVLSHIAAGGGWTTVITLVNTSGAAVPVTVALHNDDGSAVTLPVTTTQQGLSQTTTSSSVNATMNPDTTLLISMGSQVASTVVGWADVTSTGPVGGFAIFRQTPQTGSPSEGTVPLQSQFPSTITLAYDNTAGFVMGVALANLSASSANITATIWDDSGSLLGTQTITIAGSGHTAFVLPNQLTLTTGRRGIVQFQSAATGGITGLGLRFSPFGTFTSVPTM
jgi:virginiamycin B lyase